MRLPAQATHVAGVVVQPTHAKEQLIRQLLAFVTQVKQGMAHGWQSV